MSVSRGVFISINFGLDLTATKILWRRRRGGERYTPARRRRQRTDERGDARGGKRQRERGYRYGVGAGGGGVHGMVCLGRGERVERGKAPYGDGGSGGGDVVAPPGERVLSGLLDQQQHAQRGGALIHLGELGLARQVDRLLLHLQSGTGVRGRVRGVGGASWWCRASPPRVFETRRDGAHSSERSRWPSPPD